MTRQLVAGPPATAADLQTARERERLLLAELPRVREVAASWRNGLGGLLAALVGFSLIKGRSDIGDLTGIWSRLVGLLLLVALIVGATGALLLIRAANGPASVTSIRQLQSRAVVDHIEAHDAAVALGRGIVLTLTCAAFLVAAVGATWYGPARDQPVLWITTPSGVICGSVARISHGILTLKTAAGEVTADLTAASVVEPMTKCP